jgi:hypothetical protein
VLSGVLENCDVSVKAEVGPTFFCIFQPVLWFRFRLLTSSGSATLFLTPLTLFTDESTMEGGSNLPEEKGVYRRL